MDGRNELQLLPGTKKRLGIKVPGENRFLYIGSAILGAVLVTMFSLGRYQASLESQIGQVNDQITELEKTRNKGEEQNLKLFKDRIAMTSSLLDNHIYWTQALNTIVSLTQNSVRFKTFSGDYATAKIGITIQASNYTALARQVASFLTDDSIANLSLDKITPSTSGILDTSFSITFNKVKLLQKNR